MRLQTNLPAHRRHSLCTLLRSGLPWRLLHTLLPLSRGTCRPCHRRRGFTALHLAAGENHVATIKLLLYHKAAPGAQDKYGYAPDDLQLCALRMEIRTTVEAASSCSSFGLARRSHTDSLKPKTTVWSDCPHSDSCRSTALHYAAKHGHADALVVLLAAADAAKCESVKNRNGYGGDAEDCGGISNCAAALRIRSTDSIRFGGDALRSLTAKEEAEQSGKAAAYTRAEATCLKVGPVSPVPDMRAPYVLACMGALGM